jgi:putative transcriptional regulator
MIAGSIERPSPSIRHWRIISRVVRRDAKHVHFERLLASVKQASRIRRGKAKASRLHEVRPADIKAIRGSLGMSQSEFALMIGVSVATLQNWEQGRRRPEGPAQALLRVAAANPGAVATALQS